MSGKKDVTCQYKDPTICTKFPKLRQPRSQIRDVPPCALQNLPSGKCLKKTVVFFTPKAWYALPPQLMSLDIQKYPALTNARSISHCTQPTDTHHDQIRYAKSCTSVPKELSIPPTQGRNWAPTYPPPYNSAQTRFTHPAN